MNNNSEQCRDLPPHSLVSSSLSSSLLSSSITLSLKAENLPFPQTFPTFILYLYWTDFTITGPDRTGLILLLGLYLVRFFFNLFVCPVWWTELATRRLFTER